MSDTKPVVIRSRATEWIPLVEEGVKTAGLFFKRLRYDDKADRTPTLLLKLEPGGSYPNHDHPGGEELYVLEGEVTVGDITLTAGDYLYAPPGSRHSVHSANGGVLLAVIPEEVRIVD